MTFFYDTHVTFAWINLSTYFTHAFTTNAPRREFESILFQILCLFKCIYENLQDVQLLPPQKRDIEVIGICFSKILFFSSAAPRISESERLLFLFWRKMEREIIYTWLKVVLTFSDCLSFKISTLILKHLWLQSKGGSFSWAAEAHTHSMLAASE